MTGARLQIGTGAGAGDALATFRQKKGAVRCALDKSLGAVEKLVGYPFQWNATVRAAVFVDKYLMSLAYRKQRLAKVHKSFAARVGQAIQ